LRYMTCEKGGDEVSARSLESRRNKTSTHLLRAVDLRPVPEQTEQDLLGESGVLLEELDDAVGELRVIEGEGLGLVERNEGSGEEGLVLLLEWEGESVNDGPEDLEQLSDSVVTLGLIDELEEHVVDGASDEGSEVEEASVDSMQRRLEKVSLPRVLAVEEFEELERRAEVRSGQGEESRHV
jgi:hypothetical protein